MKPTVDSTVPRNKKESEIHHQMKAAIVGSLRQAPEFAGTVVPERGVGYKRPDVQAIFRTAPPQTPLRRVYEVEYQSSKSADELERRLRTYLRFGFAVYMVFHKSAAAKRRRVEETLRSSMSTQPALGMMSLEEDEFELGYPITLDTYDFEIAHPLSEFRLPFSASNKQGVVYDYGDFYVDGDRYTIFLVIGENSIYASRCDESGQTELPQQNLLSKNDLTTAAKHGELKRVSPVRGVSSLSKIPGIATSNPIHE